MSMISKQVEDLRKMAERWRNPNAGAEPYRMCGEAADTIEALSAKVRANNLYGGWIPVSERLPERDEIVLVCYKTTDTVHMCKYMDDGSENPWWSYKDDCCVWNNVVLAWMPLPEPYKEPRDE